MATTWTASAGIHAIRFAARIGARASRALRASSSAAAVGASSRRAGDDAADVGQRLA